MLCTLPNVTRDTLAKVCEDVTQLDKGIYFELVA